MYMKVFPHGKGSGDMPTNYLTRPDYPGRDEQPPEVLRGDPDVTRELVNSLNTKWTFTAGVLSWHPDDKVTPEQEERVMDDFEAVAFAGLEADQRNILWVRHVHAGHHELHFVIPRVELASGKSFNACPPGWQKHFDLFRDLANIRERWARPDDPARARLHTPEHADLHKARLIRWGATPGKDERTEAKEAVHAFLQAKLEANLVHNRADILAALQEVGLEINRSGKDYITVKDPESGEKLRLKGGIYAEQWQYTPELADRTDQGQNRAGYTGNRNPDPATVRELKQELERIVEKRAQYNRKQYPQKYVGLRADHQFPLPSPELGIREEMSASRPTDRLHHHGGGVDRLGADSIDTRADHGFAAGDRGIESRENGLGAKLSADPASPFRSAAVSGQEPDISGSSGRPDFSERRRSQQTDLLGNRKEISYDRTRTDAQGHTEQDGTGLLRRADRSGQNTRGTAAEPERPQPEPEAASGTGSPEQRRFAGISAATARFKQCIQELGTLVATFERAVERQIERAREQARERDQGSRLRM
jgi:hypothetical protein